MKNARKLCIVASDTHAPHFEQGVIQYVNDIAGEYAPDIIEPVKTETRRFSNGEVSPIITGNLRGNHAVVVGELSHETYLNYLFALNICREEKAKSVAAVITKLCYDRQDRRDRPGTCNQLCVIAHPIGMCADEIILFDPHSLAVQSAFWTPGQFATPKQRFALRVVVTRVKEYIAKKFGAVKIGIVAPDAGASKVADAYSKLTGWDLAQGFKYRPEPNVASVSSFAESGKMGTWDVAVIVDDMADTLGTLMAIAKEIRARNKRCVILAACAHPVLSGGPSSFERLADSEISKLFVADTMHDLYRKFRDAECTADQKRMEEGFLEMVCIQSLVAQSILVSFLGIRGSILYKFPYNPQEINDTLRKEIEKYCS